MAKPKADVETVEAPVVEVAPDLSKADERVIDPSQFNEVILGSAVAEPLPETFIRVDF